MFQIYLYHDPGAADRRLTLLRDAARSYAPHLTEAELSIGRSPAGKPFFTSPAAAELHFSISHSGGFWACILGNGPCGMDLQENRACRQDAIAARYFSDAEADYVKQDGLSGFYRVWTRREALAKFTGLGFFGMAGELPDFGECEECPEREKDGKQVRLRDFVIWNEQKVWFHEVRVHETAAGAGFTMVWCSMEEKGEAEIVDRREEAEQHANP
ncbi:MAG: 4'-phosphopantetheinyl transferase family protein [Anaerovoracaceae bacterium]